MQIKKENKKKSQQKFAPIKNQKPILTAYYLYLEEMRFKAVRDTPTLPRQQVVHQAYQNYHFQLTQEERQLYEEKSRQITSEVEAQQYLKTLEEQYTQNLKVQRKPIKKNKEIKSK